MRKNWKHCQKISVRLTKSGMWTYSQMRGGNNTQSVLVRLMFLVISNYCVIFECTKSEKATISCVL